jgi:imidazolonepropionase-like amidohydrolase
MLREQVAQHIALKRSGLGWGVPPEKVRFPASLMGSVALIRQSFLDARWYRLARQATADSPEQLGPEVNRALQALGGAAHGELPVVIEAANDQMELRALGLLQEFDLDLMLRGSGQEYRQLDILEQSGTPIILPVNFPDAPHVADPEDAEFVTLQTLTHWEEAPANPARVAAAGIRFALTSDGLEKRSGFFERIRTAIERGLRPEDALTALTIEPARLLGVTDQLGTVAVGKRAHLIVADGEIFSEDTRIRDLWIDGLRHEITLEPGHDLRGRWQLGLESADSLLLDVEGETPAKLKAKIRRDSTVISLEQISLEHRRVALVASGDSLGHAGLVRLSGFVAKSGDLTGEGAWPEGRGFAWSATRLGPVPEEAPEESDEPDSTAETASPEPQPDETEPPPEPLSPPGAYGLTSIPEQPRDLLITGASVWTSGPDGILEDADLLIREGRIVRVGSGLEAPAGAVVVEAAGRHVTPGLVDAHVHIAIEGGVNEWTQAVSAEVRASDVIDPYDIHIYRQLAGGTTTVHTMHGSANPIGGQNATLKLRWGGSADDLLIDDAAPTIKFALGENVKHSNRGDAHTVRYPQTRMGVAQIIRDRLRAARDYERAHLAFERGKGRGRVPPRRDLELDALVEVLNGDRLVHCHSYRQDEILMLIRVAEEFGFTIGTFQHVLEGYKIAEAIAAHGAGASTFADHWGYKFEVYDAIPHNAALMRQVGVGVSINTDVWVMGGRLFVDAAKAVRYGGLSPEEALITVTLEPARQLGVEHRLGSLEPGKDADFVIWSASPLSSYTRCEQTWIDGRRYFDLETDAVHRDHIQRQKARIIQRILSEDES